MQSNEKKGQENYLFPDCSLVSRVSFSHELVGFRPESNGADGKPTDCSRRDQSTKDTPNLPSALALSQNPRKATILAQETPLLRADASEASILCPTRGPP